MASDNVSLIRRWMGVGGQRLTPNRFADSVPILQQVGWSLGSVCTGAENITSNGIRSQVCLALSESLRHYAVPSLSTLWNVL
jgi:hypothetical protein